MGRSKAPKYIRDRRKEPQRKLTKSTEQWWKLPLQIIGGVSAAVGLIVGVLSVLPKLSLDTSGSLRPHDPMGTVFYLSNDGILPIYNIEIGCVLSNVRARGGSFIGGEGTFNQPQNTAPLLSPGKKMTVPCATSVAIVGEAEVAEMTVVVDYKPALVFWRKRDKFPLKAQRSEEGTWIWRNVPE